MAGNLVTFELHGFKDVSKFLWGTRGRARDLRPIWPAVGDVIATGMAQQFATGGRAGGRPWAPLKPDYLQWKIAHGYSSKTLIRTGAMMRSLTSRPFPHERYFMARAEFGTNSDYYPFHHDGTRFMPQRRVMFVFEPMESRFQRKVAAWIMDGVTG